MDDFDRVYEEHAQPLLRFLIYRTGDRALAEDLVADTFERVLKARSRFNRRKASERTWIYTIALNVLRDHQRRVTAGTRAAERNAVAAGASPPDQTERVENVDLIRRGLSELAPEEREAIALRYGADLTLPEIAQATGEKLSTVEGRVYRALRKLRQILA
ncbi:MAG: sigma-70 family RNA polymerase sigma factor [Solirubrobacteraceae bacterium]